MLLCIHLFQVQDATEKAYGYNKEDESIKH